MRRVLCLLALLVVGTGVSVAADLPEIDKWVNYEAPDKSFKAIYPETPKESDQTVKQTSGDIKINMYIVELGETGALLIASNDMPKLDTSDTAKVKQTLDGGIKGAMVNLKGKITKETDIMWQGKYPGRDVEATAKLGEIDGIFRVKMILANDKLYQVMAVGVNDMIGKPEIGKFLDSIEIK